MPRVPGERSNVVQGPGPQMDPTLLMMAAAGMHEQGRLFEPTPMAEPPQTFEKKPAQRVQEGHEDATPAYNKIWEGGDRRSFQNKRGDILDGRLT